jgi:uncharacterized protein (TIGR04222 family)
MDFLTDNFIANMYGPYFLLLYGFVIIILLIACSWANKFFDTTDQEPELRVPAEPDPYFISFLRGGEVEVLKIVLYNLIAKGYLIVSTTKTSVKQKKNHPPVENLTALEKDVFKYSDSKTIISLANNETLLSKVVARCKELEHWKNHKELIFENTYKEKFDRIRLVCAAFIVLLGGYKLLVALSKGHSNILFLIIFCIGGIVMIWKIVPIPRLTKKGEKFLENLKIAFQSKHDKGGNGNTPYYLLLLAGIFGFSILSTQGYSYIDSNIRKYSNWNTSGCGSGCGSGGGSGGGCGGGGCGGGCGGCGG